MMRVYRARKIRQSPSYFEITLSKKLLKELGWDPQEYDLFFRQRVEDGKIVLEPIFIPLDDDDGGKKREK